MNKLALTKFAKNVGGTLSKHSPGILTGIGIAGMLTTTVLAVKATPKALRLVEEKKKELNSTSLPPIETVKATWKCYLPAALTGAAAIACLIGANSVSARRYSALATAYKLSEKAFTEYRGKVVETIGEKKERSVRDKISEQQIKDNPVSTREVIITSKGSTLFFEPLSHRYFYSTLDKIKRAENNLNKQIICDAFDSGVTINDFYEEIGIPPTETGDSMGWKIDYLIDIYPSAQMAEEGTEHEGEPCIVLNHMNPPQYDFL